MGDGAVICGVCCGDVNRMVQEFQEYVAVLSGVCCRDFMSMLQRFQEYVAVYS